MSDKPIEVGKWAVIYKPSPCCGLRQKAFGIPFIVEKIRTVDLPNCRCNRCGKSYPNIQTVVIGYGHPFVELLELCKRLDDPPEEDELQQIMEDTDELLKQAEKQLTRE